MDPYKTLIIMTERYKIENQDFRDLMDLIDEKYNESMVKLSKENISIEEVEEIYGNLK